MRRSVVRLVVLLALTMAVALSTMGMPALAGESTGGGAVLRFLVANPNVHCAYFVDTLSGHTFFGINTGQGVKLVGPVSSTSGLPTLTMELPGGVGQCTNLTPS